MPVTPASIRVLLVEDYESNQEVASRLLTMLGCEVDVAGDGEAALEAISKVSYDLVFMDFHLPDIDGFETTRRIRKAEEATGERLPIVAITADAIMITEQKCRDAGMDGYLRKPISYQDFERVLHELVPRP